MDKFLRAVFVALAVGFAWGIRGHFGHLIGAMFPGAMLGLGFAYVSGQKAMFRWMPVLGAIGGLGIAIGGYTSYAVLHGYAQSGPPASWHNYAYGYAMLVVQGGCWGIFGCAALGAILDPKKPSITKFLELIALMFFCGWGFQYIMTQWVGFHVNPPRSDALLGHAAAAVVLVVWLIWNNYRLALRGALLGFCGFGMGMIIGRALGNAFHTVDIVINHWNIMEITVGLVGGFVFTLGMLGKEVDERPRGEGYPLLSLMSMCYVLALIPYFHFMARIMTSEGQKDMQNHAVALGIENTKEVIQQGLFNIEWLIKAGWIAAGVWLILHFLNWRWFSWFPVLALGALISFMDLFSQLYFTKTDFSPFYTTASGATGTDMRVISMGLFALMILYVLVRQFFCWHKPIIVSDAKMDRIPYIRWAFTCIVIYACIFALAHFGITNGKKTLETANTRWPAWSWKEGSFPQQVDDNAPPADNDVPPADNDAPPADNDVPPANNDAPPADNNAPPADNNVPPADNDVPPTDNNAPPADNDAPPAE